MICRLQSAFVLIAVLLASVLASAMDHLQHTLKLDPVQPGGYS
jgi:hypothetical protein